MWYCPLPFKHVFVDSTGVSPCCMINRQSVDISTWHTHPTLTNIQQTLLQGGMPKECIPCAKQEELQGRSLRTDSNKDYNHEIFKKTEINFIDYRASNICNFKCRSCEPVFSNGIDHEAKRNPELQKFFNINATKVVSVTDTNKSWIMSNLAQIDRLMFTGGEPTLIPETKEILEKIIKTCPDKISVLITTNASFEDSFWFDLVKRLPNLHWTVSIDAVGPAATIVRHGTDWDRVEYNLNWLAENANSLDINTVITSLNVLQLKPVLELGRKMQLKSISPNGQHGSEGCRHQFFITQRPQMLSPANWPSHLKPNVLKYLEQCLDLDLNQEQYNTVTRLINLVQDATFNPILWAEFQKYNLSLDKIRSENHLELFENKY